MLEFDEPSHTYKWNGKLVPNVTSIISDLTSYDMVKRDDLEMARQKGTAVHKMIEYWAKGIDINIPTWMVPVHAEWIKFVSETGLRVLGTEKRCYNRQYSYATTLDLCVTMRSKEGLGILEIKRSFMAGKAIGLQTAAQAAAWESEGGDKIRWRGALKIKEGLSYRMEDHEDRTDFTNFLACLIHYNLVKRYKT